MLLSVIQEQEIIVQQARTSLICALMSLRLVGEGLDESIPFY